MLWDWPIGKRAERVDWIIVYSRESTGVTLWRGRLVERIAIRGKKRLRLTELHGLDTPTRNSSRSSADLVVVAFGTSIIRRPSAYSRSRFAFSSPALYTLGAGGRPLVLPMVSRRGSVPSLSHR